jgi:hypothetical protein
MFPWIPYLQSTRKRLSDTEFLAIKEFDSKLITVTGAIDAVNDTIEYVPATGKTFYLHEAHIVPTAHSTSNAIEADFKVDGTVIDTVNYIIAQATHTENKGTANAGGAGWGYGLGFNAGKFVVKGVSLEGNSTKKIEIENVLDGGSGIATLVGWIETTGDSPQV